MLSLKSGRPIAYIGNDRKKVIYIKEKALGGLPSVEYDPGDTPEYTTKKHTMQPLPNRDWVEKLYVSGPSGAGKSTYVARWLAEYRRMFKEPVAVAVETPEGVVEGVKRVPQSVYIFSSVSEDPPLDRQHPIRIALNEELLLDPIEPSEFSDSAVLFDDVGALSDVGMRKYLQSLQDLMLEISRHHRTRMIITSHLTCNYGATRRVLTEMTSLTIYPHAGSTRGIRRVLEEYVGLEKHEINKLLKLPSRWVTIYMITPQYVIHERGAYVLNPASSKPIEAPSKATRRSK
jgi:hypothetical protein